ncbi:MAG: hypothetical protein WCX29_02320 [Candidatus Peribacteraceae bacterium]
MHSCGLIRQSRLPKIPMHVRLLLIGTVLLLPTTTHAAECPGDAAAAFLGLRPVSGHYVQRILDRTEAGLSYANQSQMQQLSLKTLFFPWIDTVLTGATQLIDTELRIRQASLSLTQHTPCLYVDVRILQAYMEKVRCELSNETMQFSGGTGRVNAAKILRLVSLLGWMHERERQLLGGALDPMQEDENWHQKQLFDNPENIWCAIMYASEEENNTCKPMSEEECWSSGGDASFDSEAHCWESLYGGVPDGVGDPERLCPFHSNYLPATVYGYGCDTETLRRYSGIEAIRKEYEGMQKVEEARSNMQADARELAEMLQQIDTMLGNAPEYQIDAAPERTHEEVWGCYSDLRDYARQNGVQIEDENDNDGVRRNILYLLGATRWEIRGPFNLEKDEPKLMESFLELRTTWGVARKQSDDLKLPLEFQTERERQDAILRDKVQSPGERFLRMFGRSYMQSWNTQQALEEATILAKSTDDPMALEHEMLAIRKENLALAQLAIDKTKGARQFTRAFAALLRVSCVFRPCTMQLDNILKYVLEDSCFPFTESGYYGYQDGYPPDLACKQNAEPFCILPNGERGTWQLVKTGTVITPKGEGGPTPVFECQPLK